ncbi:hypothetical protein ACILE2_01625 [Capnocytophaga canimorsus]|uniref:hypothetical protein n=1 Tax=Capnocytophaga canimorsus TaxID=28188 RepID=UPI0037D86161
MLDVFSYILLGIFIIVGIAVMLWCALAVISVTGAVIGAVTQNLFGLFVKKTR